jgi:hypothetical protein
VFLLPVWAAELVVRILTVTNYCVGHGIATLETVAVCWRQYGWSVKADDAVIVCCTRILVCRTFVPASTCDATRSSDGSCVPSARSGGACST